MIQKIIGCSCYSLDHILSLTSDDENVYLDIKFAAEPLNVRIKKGLKYIIGGSPIIADFVLDRNKVEELKQYLASLEIK